jgi:hypothetical protein
MSFERKQNDQKTEVSISYQSFHKYILNKHRLEILKLTLPTATFKANANKLSMRFKALFLADVIRV